MTLTREQQTLDVGRRKSFAAAGRENHAQVEPLHAGRDPKLRLDVLNIPSGAPLQSFLERDRPFALESGKFAGEKIEDGILAEQLELFARRGESLALKACQCGAL